VAAIGHGTRQEFTITERSRPLDGLSRLAGDRTQLGSPRATLSDTPERLVEMPSTRVHRAEVPMNGPGVQ
jgi:hypothetical protein